MSEQSNEVQLRKKRRDTAGLIERGSVGWQKEGAKDKFVVAVLKAGVSESKVVNHTFVSKGSIRATCQQLVPTPIPYCVCVIFPPLLSTVLHKPLGHQQVLLSCILDLMRLLNILASCSSCSINNWYSLCMVLYYSPTCFDEKIWIFKKRTSQICLLGLWPGF